MGGMFASWFDGGDDTEMGVVRGLTVGGLSMASTALLAASGLMHVAIVNMMPQTGGPAANPTQAAHYVATLMWVAFGSALVSLITSVVGGWLAGFFHNRFLLAIGRDEQKPGPLRAVSIPAPSVCSLPHRARRDFRTR
ncbi:MAG: hypothetical protein WB823_15990 [Steroidobacteraceae bacterium]